jgi:hypothetical protein
MVLEYQRAEFSESRRELTTSTSTRRPRQSDRVRETSEPSVAKALTACTDSITSRLPVICPEAMPRGKITSYMPFSRYLFERCPLDYFRIADDLGMIGSFPGSRKVSLRVSNQQAPRTFELHR